VTRVRAVVFAYHNMGIIGIRALLSNGFEVPMVFSHADDPKENRWFGSVAEFCREKGIPVHLPGKVNDPPWPQRILAASPDLLFSFYYRSMLGKEILSIPRLCAMNLHGSLLPKYRGRAPVNWVLVHGETETGVTLHVMTEKPDAGDIVAQAAVPIAFEDTALTLYGKMEKAAERLLSEILPRIAAGEIPRRRNELEKGSYFGGRKPEDGRIDWTRSAVEIYNLIRAVTRPYPGAFSMLGGEKCLVWRALPVPAEGVPEVPAPGKMVVAGGGTSLRTAGGCLTTVRTEPRVLVGTGSGLLRFEEVEWNGKTVEGEAIVSLFRKAITGGFS
jgi:UDP-4-amino-4-deoxy-L-arabinose formyltransferase/UDP-glucuronic acid dehydrogenase (UDP-4-keto-hexauronic acid decarboxylating)